MTSWKSPGRILSLAALSAIIIGTVAASSPAAKKSIQWQTDFKKAQTIAAKQKKIMMVDFYADW